MSPSPTRPGSAGDRGRGLTSSSSRKPKHSAEELDWADITDPEERRRVQNRNAQRKFREKARESKERADRDAQNQQHAGNSYRIPSGGDLRDHPEGLSGVPWGSLDFSHVYTRSRDESRRSSGRDTHMGEDGYRSASQYGSTHHDRSYPQTASYGSSAGDEAMYDEMGYIYDHTQPTYAGQSPYSSR